MSELREGRDRSGRRPLPRESLGAPQRSLFPATMLTGLLTPFDPAAPVRLLTAVSSTGGRRDHRRHAEIENMKMELLRVRFDEQARTQRRRTWLGDSD